MVYRYISITGIFFVISSLQGMDQRVQTAAQPPIAQQVEERPDRQLAELQILMKEEEEQSESVLKDYSLQDLASLMKTARYYGMPKVLEKIKLLFVDKLTLPETRLLFLNDPVAVSALNLDEQTSREIAVLILTKPMKQFFLSLAFTPLQRPDISRHPLLADLKMIDCKALTKQLDFISQGTHCIALTEYAVVAEAQGGQGRAEKKFYDVSLYDAATGKRDCAVTGLQPEQAYCAALSGSSNRYVVSSMEGIALWDLVSRKRLWSHKKEARGALFCCISPDEKVIALVHLYKPSIILIDFATGILLHACHLDPEDRVNERDQLQFSPNGRMIIVGTTQGKVCCWNVQTGERQYAVQAHKDKVSALYCDDTLVHTAGGDWKTRSLISGVLADPPLRGEKKSGVVALQGDVTRLGVKFSHNGDYLMVFNYRSPGGSLLNFKQNKTYPMPLKHYFERCCFSPDDRILAVASASEIYVAPLSNEQPFRLKGHGASTLFMSFSELTSQGYRFATGASDEVRLWHALETDLEITDLSHALFLLTVYEAASRKQACEVVEASAAYLVLNSLDPRLRHAVRGLCHVIPCVRHQDDEANLPLTLTADPSLKEVLDNPFAVVQSGASAARPVLNPILFGRVICTLAKSAVRGLPQWIDPWLDSTKRVLYGHDAPVTCIAFDPVGMKIASGSSDGTIKLWDSGTGDCILTIKAHKGPVFPLCFDASGSLLASSARDGIRVWDLAQKGLSIMHSQKNDSSSLCFDPTGQLLFAGSHEGRITELFEGKEKMSFVAHRDAIWCLNIDASGTRIVSSDNSGSLKVWEHSSGKLLYEDIVKERLWHVSFDRDNYADSILFAHHAEGVDCINIVDQERSRMRSLIPLLSPWVIVIGKPEPRCIWLGADNSIVISSLKDFRTWDDDPTEPVKSNGLCALL